MRRKNKYVVNGALLAGSATALVDIVLQWSEHRSKGVEFSWENYDGWRTIRRSLVGAAIGGGFGYAYYQCRLREEAMLPFNSDNFLKKVLTEEHLKSDPSAFKNMVEYREKIKHWLAIKFREDLVAFPEDTGSFIKRTAIASNYDLDIILPFRKESYNSLKEMYYDVYNNIAKEYGRKAAVTKQTKAIGVTFEKNGVIIHFDIVPGREISNYSLEKDINLYVRPDYFWQSGTSFKTNVRDQKNITVNKPEARAIIKLLKAYRDRNILPLPTLIIEQCVVEALSENRYGIYSSMTENLLNCMDYISNRIENRRLIDFTNSNNNLISKINELDKIKIFHKLRNDAQKIEENTTYIKEIF